MKNLVIMVLLVLIGLGVNAQKNTAPAKPKLVVGIVVDQMRWDFLYRYEDRYGNDGLKRMMREGFNCNNTFINYTPTYTAAGHASIYTGSVPAINGILGNNWYNRSTTRTVYCTDDSTVVSVGSTGSSGKMSPVNMLTTTISDELRLATNFRSKVIGVALKDRGSILPAGHSANGAYWFDNASGGFITSSYYMNDLPAWVKNFNDRKLPDQYLEQNWHTLYPINTYIQSSGDNKIYENESNIGNTFPHMTANLTGNRYSAFKFLPQANTYTLDMAKAAIEGENLGKGEATDLLAISFSTPDYVGHEFGPNSIEMEDTYLRLDKDLAGFLQYLDNNIGKGNYLVFLTADHGVTHVPGFLQENKIPAGVLSNRAIEMRLDSMMKQRFNLNNGISKVINYQVYINRNVTAANRPEVLQAVIEELLKIPEVTHAFELDKISNAPLPVSVRNMLVNGFNQKLGGDIQFLLKPQYYDGWAKGTSHGAWFNYDSHIPLLWYGWGIKHGSTYRTTHMTDIAATLAALLKVQMPSGCIGNVIEDVMK